MSDRFGVLFEWFVVVLIFILFAHMTIQILFGLAFG